MVFPGGLAHSRSRGSGVTVRQLRAAARAGSAWTLFSRWHGERGRQAPSQGGLGRRGRRPRKSQLGEIPFDLIAFSEAQRRRRCDDLAAHVRLGLKGHQRQRDLRHCHGHDHTALVGQLNPRWPCIPPFPIADLRSAGLEHQPATTMQAVVCRAVSVLPQSSSEMNTCATFPVITARSALTPRPSSTVAAPCTQVTRSASGFDWAMSNDAAAGRRQ